MRSLNRFASFFIMFMLLFTVGCGSMTKDNQDDGPSDYGQPVHLSKKNHLYLIEYPGSQRRCYAIRVLVDPRGIHSGQVNMDMVCNDQPLAQSTDPQYTEFDSIDNNRMYNFVHPTYGDTCDLMRVELGTGKPMVELTCTFVTLDA